MERKVALTVESGSDGKIWGRVSYDDNLIVENAENLEELQRKIKKLLRDFHDLNPKQIEFEIAQDLSSFFEENTYLNVSAIGGLAQINPTLMRQYASGHKYPSLDRVKKIEAAIKAIGKTLQKVHLITTTMAKSSISEEEANKSFHASARLATVKSGSKQIPRRKAAKKA